MPKKKFEEGDGAFYDPFAAEANRAAIRAAIAEPEPSVGEEGVITITPAKGTRKEQEQGVARKPERNESRDERKTEPLKGEWVETPTPTVPT